MTRPGLSRIVIPYLDKQLLAIGKEMQADRIARPKGCPDRIRQQFPVY